MKKGNGEKRVKALGWKDGTVAEFLGLTPEESALIEIKLALSRKLRERRQRRMTQAQLAKKLQSSQSRIAKAETGDSSVLIEFVRAMLATGATPREIGKTIANKA
ncbi:MAG: transcriptional regulator [Acidobacteria bacterium]|nr:MAG: transcriptional regulator [Acidobacteriota bacterium]